MPATPEESLNLKRFGLVLLNLLPGLGNIILLPSHRWQILVAWLAFQLLLPNPFWYMAFFIGSVVLGLYEINAAAPRFSKPVLTHDPFDDRQNTRLGKDLVEIEDMHRPTDLMVRKDQIAEEQLRRQRADEEAIERARAKAADSQPSWLQQQLHETLKQSSMQETDPAVSVVAFPLSQQDPWQQQQTDPAAAAIVIAPDQALDPWQQQQTDPAAPHAVPDFMESTGSLLADTAKPSKQDMQLSEAGKSCPSCGFLRDHDFAFCPKCATMF